jgi:hypothetical protein
VRTARTVRLCGHRGSGGTRLLAIDVVAPPLVPLLYPERLRHARRRTSVGLYASIAKGPRIPRDQWPLVRAQARRDGLRATARAFGVSYETIRTILRVDDGYPAVGAVSSPAAVRKRCNSNASAA